MSDTMTVPETTDPATHGVTLTDVAADKVRSLLEQEGRDDLRLRVAVQPGGCSGLIYQLYFDERLLDGDSTADFGGVEVVVDPMRRKVWVGEREVQLSNKEFSLLRALASDPHRVFSKRELLGDVWGFQAPARTRTLDSHASRLRRKLDPEHGRYVVNCWGVGYRLIDG